MVITKTAIATLRKRMASLQRKRRKNDSKLSNEEQQESLMYNALTDCPVPCITCVCKGAPLPTKVEGDDAGVRMRCTNNRCHLVKLLLHEKCFEQLEENLLKRLQRLGSARGWTDLQLRANLWEKKGLTLINKFIRCHCGQGLMSRDMDYYKNRELGMVKVADQQQADKQRKKKNIKKKLPSLNFNSNVPVAPELLQNDYVGSNRRASHGYTSNSSPLLLYGQTISDSESESVYELRRSLAPTPTKSKLIVEKPKPLSADRPNPKLKLLMGLPTSKPLIMDAPTPKPLAEIQALKPLLPTPKLISATKLPSKQRKEQAKLAKSSESKSGKERKECPRKEETIPKNTQGVQQMVLQQPQLPQEAVKKDGEANDSAEQSERCYTLFDCSCGFFLGELLLAEAHLPRLLVPPSA